MEVAVLITCFNRKEKTLACIKDIYAQEKVEKCTIDIYIVDGGSTDGTPKAIKETYPDVKLKVCQNLYWAGGMREAWKEASQHKDYDFFWLLNDDTHIYSKCLNELIKADQYCLSAYNIHGIYIGSTENISKNRQTYGGRKLYEWGKLSNYMITPTIGKYQNCDLGNANIMLVHREVYHKIGGFDTVYTHGIADYDYTLKAKQANIPVLIAPSYLGTCEDDHQNSWNYKAPIRQRIKFLFSPKGFAYKEYLYYIRKFFPKYYLSEAGKLWIRTLCPWLWNKLKKIQNANL